MFYPDFLEGRPAFFDVSVRNSMQPSYVSKAAIKPGAVAEAGEIDKDEKHDKVVTQAGGHFYPLIVETLGHWSPSSVETLKTIASKASSMNSIPFSQTYSNLMEQLSVRLWQFGVVCIEEEYKIYKQYIYIYIYIRLILETLSEIQQVLKL